MPFKPNELARACLFMLLLFIGGSLYAQTTVTGKVTSSTDNQPLAGATVQVKGSKVATQTASDGSFSITSSKDISALVITVVGFEQRTVAVNGRGSVGDISLSLSNTSLSDVVVTGYTAQKKKDITGAVSVVNVAEMKEIPAGNPENMLQGQAAGLSIISSGSPGAQSDIRIRGITTFGQNQPLVIIDGIQSDLHDINANDIESIQVLKDAGAAAIYGVRASNGVIIVTTKKGRSGKAKIAYDGYYGTQIPVKGFSLANSQEYANVLWHQAYNSGVIPTNKWFGTGGATYSDPVLPNYLQPAGASTADPSTYDINSNQIVATNKAGTDWWKAVFKSAPIQSHNLSASGGSDKSAYYFSFGFFDQQGTLINTYLKRYSVRANTVFNVKDHIRVGENLYVFYKDNPSITNQNEGNAISEVYRMPPLIPIYDIKGNYAGTKSFTINNSANPVAQQQRSANNKGNDWQIKGNAFAEADFLKHFTIRTSIGGTIDNYYYYNFNYTPYENAEGNTSSNSFSEGSGYNSSWTWTNTLKYTNVFAQKHSLTVLVGTEAIENYGRSLSGGRSNYVVTNPGAELVDPNTWVLNAGSPAGATNGSSAYQSSLYSQFGRLDYAFDDRYLLSVTVRRDGSSYFAPAVAYGVFPSITAGWRISREAFFKDVTFINDLKIRGGWGKLGNNINVPPTNQYNLYNQSAANSYYDISGTSNNPTLGFYQYALGNLHTTWEKDVTTNVGFDATLLNNKFDVTFDWYKKTSSDLLFQPGFAATLGGATPPYQNYGSVQNTGIDGSVTYHGTVSKDFKFNVGVIFTTYVNKITTLPVPGYTDIYSAGSSRIGAFTRAQVGQPIGEFFGYKVIGLFQNASDVTKSPTQDGAGPGRFKYADINGDGKIDQNDRTFLGNPNPKFTYGINLGASYKQFDFSMIFYGSAGNKDFNYTKYWTDFPQVFEGNVSKALVYNSWTPSNPNAKIPIIEQSANFSNSTVVNSYYIENGSFLKCRSLILGYTLSPQLLKQVGFDRLRIYVQGTNLFTITKYDGLDPELQGAVDGSGHPSATTLGVDLGNYPNNQRGYLVGLSLTF